jgi:hypothetical protein
MHKTAIRSGCGELWSLPYQVTLFLPPNGNHRRSSPATAKFGRSFLIRESEGFSSTARTRRDDGGMPVCAICRERDDFGRLARRPIARVRSQPARCTVLCDPTPPAFSPPSNGARRSHACSPTACDACSHARRPSTPAHERPRKNLHNLRKLALSFSVKRGSVSTGVNRPE